MPIIPKIFSILASPVIHKFIVLKVLQKKITSAMR